MAGFSVSRHIDAPRDVVFNTFSEIERAAEVVSGIERVEMLSQGPVGVGTKWRETRVMFKKEATETLTITRFDPPQSYTIGCQSCGCDFQTTFRFEESDGGTDVHVNLHVRAMSFAAKIMSPVTGLMMGPTMKKCLNQDLDDLQRAVEADKSTSPADQ